MMLRIIHGKLKPGTWDAYERAYEDVMAEAGKIPGLRGRWLAHAVDDPDAGYTIHPPLGWNSFSSMPALPLRSTRLSRLLRVNGHKLSSSQAKPFSPVAACSLLR